MVLKQELIFLKGNCSMVTPFTAIYTECNTAYTKPAPPSPSAISREFKVNHQNWSQTKLESEGGR